MPDQFGNPLPGEPDPSFIHVTGAPVAGVTTPPQLAQVQPAQGMPQLDIPDYSQQPGAVAQPAQEIAQAQPATPTQFVSAPSAKAPAGPGLFDVVGSIPTGTQTSVSRVDLGKGGEQAAKAREVADRQTLDAGALKQAIAQEKADAQAQAAVARGAAASAADAQIAQHTAKMQKDAADGVAGIKRASDDYERAAAELSPNHFWQQQSTGQKIGNLLAIALSGVGAAFAAKAGRNQSNGALDLINAAIDRDIDMQKTALQAKERGIRTKESLYQTIRQQGADDLTAMAATKAAALGKVERELDVKIAQADTKEAAAQGEALKAAVGAQRAAELQRIAELEATRVQSTSGSRPVLGLEVAQMAAGAQAAQQDAERERLGLVKKDPKLDVPGFGQATDPESKRLLVEAKLAFDPAENSLKVLEALSKKSVLGPADERLFRAARSKLITFANGKYGAQLGALAGPDKALLDEQIGDRDAMSLLSGGDQSALKHFRKNFDLTRDALKGYTVRTQ